MSRGVSANIGMKMIGSCRMLMRVGLGFWILVFATNANAINAVDVDRFSKIGLGQPQKIRQLAKAFCEIDFSDFPIKLQEKLDEALSKALHSTMPAPSIVFNKDVWGVGSFSHRTWTIELSTKLLSKKKLVRLLQILTHELRHAEQWYISATYHAAIGTPEEDKKSYTNLQKNIIEHALNNPSAQDSDEFDFGQFISNKSSDDNINEKKKYLLYKMKSVKNNKKSYNFYYNRYMNELPRERDAKSVDQALRGAVEECLPGKRN